MAIRTNMGSLEFKIYEWSERCRMRVNDPRLHKCGLIEYRLGTWCDQITNTHLRQLVYKLSPAMYKRLLDKSPDDAYNLIVQLNEELEGRGVLVMSANIYQANGSLARTFRRQ